MITDEERNNMRTEKEIITKAKEILKKHYTLKHMDMGDRFWHVTIDDYQLFSFAVDELVKAKIRFYVTTDTNDPLRLGINIKE